MIKVDLHTHSVASPDGGLTTEQYNKLIGSSAIDCLAVTEHGNTTTATELSTTFKENGEIIAGQEVLTTHGEIIGLFLAQKISDGLSPQETVVEIKKQGGFVLIPHPEDRHRNGLDAEIMDTIVEDIDAIETINGRQIGKPKVDIKHWAKQNNIPGVAASDAHSMSGVGRTYTMLREIPKNSEDLRRLLSEKTRLVHERPRIRSYLAPKFNRLRRQ